MSSDIVVDVKNISKCYHMFDKPKDRLLQSLYRNRKKLYKEFWALHDISFQVGKGECIGILGRNGSGKSTLLQIITGTLKPSVGSVNINGRIAALLELGSGFNPEFTGRENIYMNGTIMGLSMKEIECRIPLIESFADIGHFIDQPVKVYSSGMFVRLAFACAINVDPDILIVDEALAVGDLSFQLKCIERMNSFKKQGKTILFVSHDVYTVRNFCDYAIWLKDGKIHMNGDVFDVTDAYQDFMKSGYKGTEMSEFPANTEVAAENICRIERISFLDENNIERTEFQYGKKITVCIDYALNKSVEGLVGGIAIYDKQNTYVCGLNTKLDKVSLPVSVGNYKLYLSYDEMNLMPGNYYLDVAFFEKTAIVSLDYKKRGASFSVFSSEYFAEGLTFIKHSWKNGEVE